MTGLVDIRANSKPNNKRNRAAMPSSNVSSNTANTALLKHMIAKPYRALRSWPILSLNAIVPTAAASSPIPRAIAKAPITPSDKPNRSWSAGRDLNPRLYGFAGRSLGPLGHRRREPQRTGAKLRGGPGASGPAAVDAACAGRPRPPSETPRSEASGAGGHGCCHRGRARVAQAGHHRSHRRAGQDHVVDHHDVASSRRLASPVAG